MIQTTDLQQQDDHCRIVLYGEHWRVTQMRPLRLVAACETRSEITVVDTSRVDWDDYVRTELFMLRARWPI